MSKAILVLEMPISCEKCRLHSFVGKDCDVVCQAKGTTRSYDDAYNDKPDWCPLKPMPSNLKNQIGDTEWQEGFVDGFNSCIDEIFGR